jgi:hypothetical protein
VPLSLPSSLLSYCTNLPMIPPGAQNVPPGETSCGCAQAVPCTVTLLRGQRRFDRQLMLCQQHLNPRHVLSVPEKTHLSPDSLVGGLAAAPGPLHLLFLNCFPCRQSPFIQHCLASLPLWKLCCPPHLKMTASVTLCFLALP